MTARICSAHLPIVRAFNQSAALLCRMVVVNFQLLGIPANKPVAATANHIHGHAIPGRRRILSVAASNRYVVFLSCSNFGLVSSLFCILMPSSLPSSALLVAAETSPGSSIYLLGNILSLLGRTKSPCYWDRFAFCFAFLLNFCLVYFCFIFAALSPPLSLLRLL